MRLPTLTLVAIAAMAAPAWGQDSKGSPGVAEQGPLVQAGSGDGIPHPTSKATRPVTADGRTLQVPETMAYIPAGEFTLGADSNSTKVSLDGYCLGKFDVTSAEYKAFVDATGSRAPSYWSDGMFPTGKANHPVVFISLDDARAYAAWVSRETGWKVAIPTSQQWEKAARGPKGFLYPWGNEQETTFAGGRLSTRFNYAAVTALQVLEKPSNETVTYTNPKSLYNGTKTTVAQIAGFDNAGHPTYLSVGPTGSVRGWVSHSTYTGFIYTDLFTAMNDSGGNTSPVGAYENGKSAYGCYDMAGNVWNWCETTIVATTGAERGRTVNEIRGGSWYSMGSSCRSTSIGEGRAPSGAYNTVGFRLVMLP